MSDNARLNNLDVGFYGVQPSIFDATVPEFLRLSFKSDSTLSIGEQLYTAKGSQGVGTGQYAIDFLKTDLTNPLSTMLVQTYSNTKDKPNKYFRKRPIWAATMAPGF